MTHEKFDEILKKRLEAIECTLSAKSKEYSDDFDRMRNFTNGAQIAGQPVKNYVWSLLCKHLECVRELAHGKLPAEYAEEKIGDAINYLILLEALIYE